LTTFSGISDKFRRSAFSGFGSPLYDDFYPSYPTIIINRSRISPEHQLSLSLSLSESTGQEVFSLGVVVVSPFHDVPLLDFFTIRKGRSPFGPEPLSPFRRLKTSSDYPISLFPYARNLVFYVLLVDSRTRFLFHGVFIGDFPQSSFFESPKTYCYPPFGFL